MTEPLLKVRDLSVELKEEAFETELLRNYEFNISQGIIRRVSRYFDALALMEEHEEATPDSARGGVMGYGRKRNVCNHEKKPARRIAQPVAQPSPPPPSLPQRLISTLLNHLRLPWAWFQEVATSEVVG